MPAIVEFPQIVQEAVKVFGPLFPNEPQRRHFAEYLTGLFVAECKNVTAINREFAETTDPSCLNRFLTDAAWDVEALNNARLALLQRDADTRYHPRGVIAIDNTLIGHDGKLIADVGWFWDHVDQRHMIAHDYLFGNYVCPSGKHYPLHFRRFRKRDLCEAEKTVFKDHTVQCQELIDWVVEQKIPGDFVFDSYFTNAPIVNYIHGKRLKNDRPRGYIGSLKFNRKVQYKGKTLKVSELAARIQPEKRKKIDHGNRQQWYFSCALHIAEINHKLRIVILWDEKEDKEARLALVSNRTAWEAKRLVGVYRQRWTGTETFHRDGKQELGMGDCQLRDSQGQTRHMHLVMLAYSLLMRQLLCNRAYEWACNWLTTIGQACRAVGTETLRKTLIWAIQQVTREDQDLDQVLAHLGLAK